MSQYNLIILFLLTTTLGAKVLSLNECITKAIDTYPEIKTASLSLQQSKSAVDVSQADYLPQINVNVEYNPTKTYALPQNGIFHTINDSSFQAGVTLKQKVWDFSKTTRTIKAYEVQESISKLSLENTKAFISYRVKQQYELIFIYKEAIKVRQEDTNSKKELYNQANAFVKLGMKTNADASRFLSSLYLAQDNLAIAEANYDKARVSLASYIGEDIPKDVQIEDTISNNTIYIKNQLLYKIVMQNNLELKSVNKGVEKSTLLYKATKSSHYGSIDAIASYSYLNTLNEYDSSLIGITLQIPLYSGGRTSALVQSSLLEKEKSIELVRNKEILLKEEFNTLIIDLKRYESTIKAKNAQLNAAKETQTLVTARYKEGLSTYIEVLDAKALYLDAKLGLLEAQYAKSSTIHHINYLQGKIL